MCGVSPFAAPSCARLRITVRCSLPGWGCAEGEHGAGGKAVLGVMLVIELRVQVGKSNLRIWVGLLMKKCEL